VADLSWVVAAMGGVVGGVAAEVRMQRRVGRRLEAPLAARWEALGGMERYGLGRQLRRGRTLPDDAELGASVAAALRAELDRRWYLWVFGVLAALFLLLTVVTLAAGSYTLAAVEAALVVLFAGLAAWQPHVRWRLAVAEEANRSAYEP
jgi:hypothetical protein